VITVALKALLALLVGIGALGLLSGGGGAVVGAVCLLAVLPFAGLYIVAWILSAGWRRGSQR
jgi:hypothetical protein